MTQTSKSANGENQNLLFNTLSFKYTLSKHLLMSMDFDKKNFSQ